MTTSAAEPPRPFSGWLPDARHLPSPNVDARPAGQSIDLIVVHSISLPPGQYGGGAVEALFTNRLDWDAHPYFAGIRGLQVSAHFFIRRDGELVQFASTLERAWHAGVSCWRGRERCNAHSIGIELEGLEGECFETAQYTVLTRLCTALAQHHPITQVVGHEHIAPGRKADPGAGFDWARLRRDLGWSHWCFPEATAPTSGTGGTPALGG